MIALQDQKIMCQYFTELLMQPLANDLLKETSVEVAQPSTEILIKPEWTIDLLPLPEPEIIRSAESPMVPAKPKIDCQPAGDQEEIDAAADNNPWADDHLNYHQDYHWENGRPPWAQENFDCLLFEVRGFNFAVPLITLGQIHLITDELTSIFGQAPWFMGLQSTAMGKIRVLNTALFVMPERYLQEHDYRPTYMVSLAQSPWALAVDQVNQPINLSPKDVKWRAHRKKHNWFAGVIKQQMCVLLDIPALAKQLLETEKKSANA